MTYRELAEYILWLGDEQMDTDVIIKIPSTHTHFRGQIECDPKTKMPIIVPTQDTTESPSQ